MAVFSVPLAFSGAVAPTQQPPWRLLLGAELAYLPKVDPAVGIPTTCRPDKTSPENTDLLFAAPRPRAWVILPSRFALEVSWLPPVRLSQVKANLIGLALSHTTSLRPRGPVLELRAHATLGRIRAPITCDDAALQDATSPCYQGTRSDDAFHPNIVGVSGTIAWRLGKGVYPYLGGGYNHLAPRFQVDFTNRVGSRDRRKVSVDLHRGVLFAGASWMLHSRVDLSGEVYSAPVDAVTVRLTGRIRLRG